MGVWWWGGEVVKAKYNFLDGEKEVHYDWSE